MSDWCDYIWLVCKKCGTKEWLQPHTPIVGCQICGRPRYAESDTGQPAALWNATNDLTSWGPLENSQHGKE